MSGWKEEEEEEEEEEEDVTRINAERLVKILRDNIPVGRRSPKHPKRRWSVLILD